MCSSLETIEITNSIEALELLNSLYKLDSKHISVCRGHARSCRPSYLRCRRHASGLVDGVLCVQEAPDRLRDIGIDDVGAQEQDVSSLLVRQFGVYAQHQRHRPRHLWSRA